MKLLSSYFSLYFFQSRKLKLSTSLLLTKAVDHSAIAFLCLANWFSSSSNNKGIRKTIINHESGAAWGHLNFFVRAASWNSLSWTYPVKARLEAAPGLGDHQEARQQFHCRRLCIHASQTRDGYFYDTPIKWYKVIFNNYIWYFVIRNSLNDTFSKCIRYLGIKNSLNETFLTYRIAYCRYNSQKG